MQFANYQVKVNSAALNCRKGPGMNYTPLFVIRDKGVYTIIAEQGEWGQIENQKGWINLKFTTRLKTEEAREETPSMTEAEPSQNIDDPAQETDEIIHVVRGKESLWDIAKHYLGSGARFVEIKVYNNLSSTIIYDGMELKIPRE